MTPAPTASFVSAEVLPTQGAGELLRVTGVGAPYTAPLHLAGELTLRAHWEQSSAGEFSFAVGPQAAPDEGVTFELTFGPSSGSGDYVFAPGDYVLEITAADGPWLIWIERIDDP